MSNTTSNIYVTAKLREDGDYRIKMQSGDSKKFVTVDAVTVIDWTDSKGYTFGITNEGVLTEAPKRGYIPAGEDVGGYISTFMSSEDWAEFAETLPEYHQLNIEATKASPALVSKYNRLKRKDGIAPRLKSTVYPLWWSYDSRGKWVMVDGDKVAVTRSHIGDYLLSQQFFAGKDETGYYLKDYGRGKTYLDPRRCLSGWNDAEWWAYAQTIKETAQAA